MQITTNKTSVNISNEIRKNQLDLSDRLTSLSTGKRINSSSDDVANLQISNRIGKFNQGLNIAIRNANDGISIVQSAEGAAQEAGNILQRMRELAIQSANATNTVADRKAISEETSQLKLELNRIAETTTFGGQLLLNGSFGAQQFQVGGEANEVIDVALTSTHSDALTHNQVDLEGRALRAWYTDTSLTAARNQLQSDGFGNGAAGPTSETLTIDGNDTKTAAVTINSFDSAKQMAAKINNEFATTNVKATASTQVALSIHSGAVGGRVAFEVDELVSFKLGNGTQTETVSMTASGNMFDDLTTLSDRINQQANVTGIAAQVDRVKNQIVLTHSHGDNIEVSDYTESSEGVNNQLALWPVDYDGSFEPATSLSNDGSAAIVRGNISLSSTSAFKVSSGNDFATLNNGAGTSADQTFSTESSVSDIDLSTQQGAQKAIAILDSAIANVDGLRSMLGGLQNRFSSTINNLTVNHENSSAGFQRLVDADVSKETAELAKLQVTREAATALLSQANSEASSAIRLLG